MTQEVLISVNVLTKPISASDVASSATNLPDIGETVMIYNEGPDTAFVAVGYPNTLGVGPVATLPNATPTRTSTVCPAGALVTYSLPPPQNTNNVATATNMPNTTPAQISAICRSGKSAVLDVAVGAGS